MKCTNCGSELREGARFCRVCGAPAAPGPSAAAPPVRAVPPVYGMPVQNPVPSAPFSVPAPVPVRNGKDPRLSCLLSMLTGLFFYQVEQFVFQLVIGRSFGSVPLAAFGSASRILSVSLSILFAVGLLLSLLKNRTNKAVFTAGSVVLLVLQVLFILGMLLFGRILLRLFSTAYEVIDFGSQIMRSMAISLFLFSVISALIGFLVKRKSVLLFFLIDLGVFLLSAAGLILCISVFRPGLTVLCLFPAALQPLVVLLPCIGRWDM